VFTQWVKFGDCALTRVGVTLSEKVES